jgi:hypothetical protein
MDALPYDEQDDQGSVQLEMGQLGRKKKKIWLPEVIATQR